MKVRSVCRLATLMLLGLTLATALTGETRTAQAFCCPPVYVIRLEPTADGAPLGLRGRAEINECLGMSFVHIVVRGSVPDGTQFIPMFRGMQPILGDWFTMTNGRGETVIQGMTLGEVTGRTLSISDTNFTDLLTGQF